MRTVKQIKNFTAAIFRYLLTFFFSFFTRRLFIDALGVEYLGVAGLMGNVLGMLAIAELGIGSSIVFSLYKPLAENNQAKVHLLISLYRRLYRYIALFVLVVVICKVTGFDIPWTLSTQAYINSLAFATGLCPIAGKYGFRYGVLAGFMSAIICAVTAEMHGGFVLYNGGFNAGLTALVIIPILDFYEVKPIRESDV